MFMATVRAAALVALVGLLAACSNSQQTFKSTPHNPKTFLLRDAVSNKTIWVKEVPVNHSLKVDLDRPGDFAPFRISTNPPTSMKWEVKDMFTGKVTEKGKLDLPRVPVNQFVAIRPAEHPVGYTPPADDLTPAYVRLPYGDPTTAAAPRRATAAPAYPAVEVEMTPAPDAAPFPTRDYEPAPQPQRDPLEFNGGGNDEFDMMDEALDE